MSYSLTSKDTVAFEIYYHRLQLLSNDLLKSTLALNNYFLFLLYLCLYKRRKDCVTYSVSLLLI
jgi:hypothetical protein